MSSPAQDSSTVVRCPICRHDSVEAYRPFCSKRCADIDLGKWFAGGYAIAGRDDEDGDGSTSEPASESKRDLED